MLGFKKSRPAKDDSTKDDTFKDDTKAAAAPTQTKGGLFSRLKEGLSKTSAALTSGMADLVMGKRAIDDDLLEEIEERLLVADVGVEATQRIIDDLTDRVARKQLADAEALFAALHEDLVAMLKPVAIPLPIDPAKRPFVILMTGVNGVGKTTTIGKLAKHLQADGYSVMLAAGDTFRAAAVEQLKVWGERNHIPVIAQERRADAASVIYDALEAAHARGIDVVIADTAGRLHTQSHLMDELRKVQRVISKFDSTAPHEAMLVVDAGTGQNALRQAQEFNAAAPLSGITVTKLDGTAKGGILFAIAEQMRLPIRFIGVGEQLEDLRALDADEFVSALLGTAPQAEQ